MSLAINTHDFLTNKICQLLVGTAETLDYKVCNKKLTMKYFENQLFEKWMFESKWYKHDILQYMSINETVKKVWRNKIQKWILHVTSFNTNHTKDQLPEFRVKSKFLQDDFSILKDWNLGYFPFNKNPRTLKGGKLYVKLSGKLENCYISEIKQQSNENFRNPRSKTKCNRNPQSEFFANLGVP